jgi:acyl-coenzyme A synthetase/AMP-(fatty) acid ligase
MGPIRAAFDRRCRDRPAAPALWSRGEGERLSFGDLARRVAAWERALDLPAGEPLALGVGNSAALVEVFLAALARGIPVLLLDAGLPAAGKLDLCRRLGVGALLHRDPELPGEELPGLRLTRLPGVAAATVAPGTVLVKLTSGSIGAPLGICLTEAALAAGIAQIGEGMELCRCDRVLIAIPLAHSYGFDNGVLSLAVLGTPLVLEPSCYPAPLLRALAEGEVSFFPAVPPLIRVLAEVDWPTGLPLTRVVSAGGPLRPDFARRFRQGSGLAVHQFYGSTETGGISFERHPEEAAAEGTVGRPLPGVEVRLGPDGAVAVESPANFHAYFGLAPRGERRVVLADRGEWTPEGRLRLVGRAADLLNVAGRRVSAAALEAALRRLPGVEDAAVVGVEDPLRGDRAVAFVVGLGAPPEPGLLPAGLAPRDVHPVAALPYTERGKLDRRRLLRLVAERP